MTRKGRHLCTMTPLSARTPANPEPEQGRKPERTRTMSLMTRSSLIYNVHNKLQLLRPLRKGCTCLETSFSATFCEPEKPFPVTIRLILNPQSCHFSPARPHISCAPRSNLLPPHLTKRPCSPYSNIMQERFVHNQAYSRHKLPAGENILFGR